MGKIIAIGGGSLSENRAINQEIIAFSSKKNPKILFVPTASLDSETECLEFKNYFESNFSCNVDFLLLIKENYKSYEIERKILEADVIFVGGGNTLMMLKIWKKYKVDNYLKKAFSKNILLCGVSAGAICWFKKGNSDSKKFLKKENPLIMVRGLGILPLIICPHYNSEKERRPSFQKMIKKEVGNVIALALEDNTALKYFNGEYSTICKNKEVNIYQLIKEKNKITENILDNNLKINLNTQVYLSIP